MNRKMKGLDEAWPGREETYGDKITVYLSERDHHNKQEDILCWSDETGLTKDTKNFTNN